MTIPLSTLRWFYYGGEIQPEVVVDHAGKAIENFCDEDLRMLAALFLEMLREALAGEAISALVYNAIRTGFNNYCGGKLDVTCSVEVPKDRLMDERPPEPGVYVLLRPPGDRTAGYKFWYSYWTGVQWCTTCGSADRAREAGERNERSDFAYDREKVCAWTTVDALLNEAVRTPPDGWHRMADKPTVRGVYEMCHEGMGTVKWYSLWADGQWHSISDSKAVAAKELLRSRDAYRNNVITGWRETSAPQPAPDADGWWPMTVLPAVPGVYEMRHPRTGLSPWYSRWDGSQWITISDTVSSAAFNSYRSTDAYNSDRVTGWRALDKSDTPAPVLEHGSPGADGWYSMDIAPTAPGVYMLRQTQLHEGPYWYSHWNGEFWSYTSWTEDEARKMARTRSASAVDRNVIDGWRPC